MNSRFLIFSFLPLLTIFFLLILPLKLKGQEYNIEKKDQPSFNYDEILIHVVIEGSGNFNLNVIYSEDQLLYVNVEELFNTLKVACNVAQSGDTITGFIDKENNPYFIDYPNGTIKVAGKIINSKKGQTKLMGSIYLESSLMDEAFRLKLNFNYRTLSAILKPGFELPVIKQMRLDKEHDKISKIKGDFIADKIFQRNYHILKFGVMDWLFGSSQTSSGLTNNHFRVGIGSEFLFGETTVSLSLNEHQKFDKNQLLYSWRWVDNSKKIIRQAQVGKIVNQMYSKINSPMIGVIIRNSPTTIRRASGYYTIHEKTEPNWTVELYINDILIDHTMSDVSGQFTFKIPIVYGYTKVILKFYGPLGEERSEERVLNTPYTFMPANEFDYCLSGGVIEDSTNSRFGKGEFSYGLNRGFTVGAGMEYVSSLNKINSIPFFKMAVQPYSRLTLNLDYAYGIKTNALLNYYFGRNTILNLDYTNFQKGKIDMFDILLETRKVQLAIPLKYGKINGFSKLDLVQNIYLNYSNEISELLLSVNYKKFSLNSSSRFLFLDEKVGTMNSNLALSYRFRNGFSVLTATQMNFKSGDFSSYKVSVEKYFFKGYFSLSYEKNKVNKSDNVNLSVKYDFSFAKSNISVTSVKTNIFVTESTNGSLLLDGVNHKLYADNGFALGKGGLIMNHFLDLNNNGMFDTNEHRVIIKSVNINGAKIRFSKKDTVIILSDLSSYINYDLEYSDNELENISWRFKYRKFKVLVDPNQCKRIDVPIIVVSEVSGNVFMEGLGKTKGVGKIIVNFYKKNSNSVYTKVLSESDGFINYFGFEPGDYIAKVDSVQLARLKWAVTPAQIEFNIKTIEEGDVVNGIDFILSKKIEIPEVIPSNLIDTSNVKGHPGDNSLPDDSLMNYKQNNKSSIEMKGEGKDSILINNENKQIIEKIDETKKNDTQVEKAESLIIYNDCSDINNIKMNCFLKKRYGFPAKETTNWVFCQIIFPYKSANCLSQTPLSIIC